MVILLVFLLMFSATAENYTLVESYRTFRKDSSFQTNVIWSQQSISKPVGVFGWGQYSTTYQQIYGGVYTKPTSWLQIGIGVGEEQFSKTPRLGSFAYASKGRLSGFGIYEDAGATGYWYLALSDYRLNNRWGVGSHSQAFFGHGPRAEFRFHQTGNWTASLRPALGWGVSTGLRPNFILGLRFTYFKGE